MAGEKVLVAKPRDITEKVVVAKPRDISGRKLSAKQQRATNKSSPRGNTGGDGRSTGTCNDGAGSRSRSSRSSVVKVKPGKVKSSGRRKSSTASSLPSPKRPPSTSATEPFPPFPPSPTKRPRVEGYIDRTDVNTQDFSCADVLGARFGSGGEDFEMTFTEQQLGLLVSKELPLRVVGFTAVEEWSVHPQEHINLRTHT